MKLARLEIVGFKSFADKVQLNFADGITSVVGPNGCGKSNIVDAIRWVMGEQSAKHLRGGKMEDVIFGGSESRGPMGMSEVTLTMKNDGMVPSEYAQYDEIAIKRRLFRDGQSEYYINKTPCRLKDIHDIFLGTGAGTRAYSMIEQGRIGFIVNSKPEERRFLIEEVAGITKYKARKKTAQRRMEATEANMLRVQDIITELGRQLGSLERQAKKAEKYKQLKQELRELELWWSSMRFLALRAELVFALGEAERVQSNAGDLETELATAETQLETSRLSLANLEANNAQYAEQVHALDSRLKVLERDLEFFARERDNLKERGVQAAEEARTLEAQLGTVATEISTLEEHTGSLAGETETVMFELDQKETQLRAMTQQRRQLEGEIEAAQRKMIEALTLLANERARIESDDKRTIELQARIQRGEQELQATEAQHADATRREATAVQDSERLLAMVEDLRDRVAALDDQVARGKQTVSSQSAKVLTLKEQQGQRRSRLTSLQEIAKKYEGYGAGVRVVMTKQDKEAAGIFGLVADVLTAKPEHESALEAALGARLQDVVVQSVDSGIAAVEWLRGQADGRATFIPKDMPTQTATALPQGAGVIARLADHVTVKPGYEAIARYLLGDVILVESLAAARALVGPSAAGLCFVTAAGEVLDGFGAVSGGKSAGVSEGLLAQKREIKELEEQVRELEAAIMLAESERAQAAQALMSAEELQKATAEELKDGQIRAAKHDKDVSVIRDEARRLSERIGQLDRELQSLRGQLGSISGEQSQRSDRMVEAERTHSEKEREIARLQERGESMAEQEAYVQEELTQLKVSYAQRDEKQKNVLRTLERLRQNVAETEERIRRAKHTVASGGSQDAELVERIGKSKDERETLLNLLEEGKATLQAGRIEHERLAQDVRAFEEKTKQLQKHAGSFRDARSEFDLKASKAMMEIEHLRKSVDESYQLDVATELHDWHMRGGLPEDAAEQISALKSQLSRMGDINLTAIEEFEQVNARHSFLVAQKTDLEQALTQLRSAIIKINRTSRDRFMEAYTATNAMFQKVFPRLFRGGEARLEMLMEGTDDVLECGIDIISQPPGKKLQSVQLLSGGEKALTAVSLVFSIFLIKPSPFCVLDEVDAPLDEANVMRFNELLREISQVSQFVVITHSKKTMECADRLYGVTMEEPGISKLVSVDLKRAGASKQIEQFAQ